MINNADGAEIIVADNASTDDSVAFLKKIYPTIRLIQLPNNQGFAGGYNAALKQISAKYYILLNSDVEVTPNWIRPIIENVADFRIKYFEKINDEGYNQQFYWYEDKGFIIIIKEINPDLLLITSFSVDAYKQRIFKTDFPNFTSEQKNTSLRK